MGQSLLILHYGQSNADCHNAGPAFDADCRADPRIVVPNDGYGFRGLAGRPRRKEISGFVQGAEDFPEVQSIGKAAAARYLHEYPDTPFSQVIVRSSAKGGRPLCGYRKKDREIEGILVDANGAISPLLHDMVEDVRQMQAAATAQGQPITQVAMPFFHGEADRAADRTAYCRVLTHLMETVENMLGALGLPVQWFLTQPSGTTSDFTGNAWPNRMSVLDLAATRENVHFAAANYAYELIDAAHLGATAKALLGELIGFQMARALHGEDTDEPVTVTDAVQGDNWIEITLSKATQLATETDAPADPRYPYGFEIDGRRSEQTVTSVEQISPVKFRINCALSLVPRQGQLRYAFSVNRRRAFNDGSQFPYGRGSLFEDWGTPSLIVPDTTLRRWVPGFAIELADIAKIAVAA